MKKFIVIAIGAISVTALATVNAYYDNGASSVGMRVKALYLGDANCQNFKTVFENSNAEVKDFTHALDLGSGNLENGSYFCVGLRVSNDLIVSTNSAAQGVCSGWNGQHIFAPGLVQNGQVNVDPNGTVVATDTDTPSDVYMYFKVGGNGDVFNFNSGGGGALSQSITITDAPTTLNFKFVASSVRPALSGSDGTPATIKDLKDVDGSCVFGDDNVAFSITQSQ